MREPCCPAGHFYSPIPNTDLLDLSKWDGPFASLLPFDDQTHLHHMRQFAAFHPELDDIQDSAAQGYCWGNDMYPPADAILYYGLLRHLQPEQVIEIGCGFSTLMAMRAMARNARGTLTCIEPYSPASLRGVEGLNLIKQRVETLDLALFERLGRGDVLFVDSSHVCKTQSDVNFVFFHILPRLRDGVFIHFHDIFLPDEYPAFWLLERGHFYNEQYLLLAYLVDNPRYEIILPTNYLLTRHEPAFIGAVQPLYEKHRGSFRRNVPGAPEVVRGGSFWMRKQPAG
jgi:hypothetical protein